MNRLRYALAAGIWLLSAAAPACEDVSNPHQGSALTVAGCLEWQADWQATTGDGALLLNGEKVRDIEYGPTILARFYGDAGPFDEVLVMEFELVGSTWAAYGPLQILGIKKSGSYSLSDEIEYDYHAAAGHPVMEWDGSAIRVTVQTEAGASETWVYEHGALRRL